jgi:hypothetical protein
VREACSGLAQAYAERRVFLRLHVRVWSRTGVFDAKDICLLAVAQRCKGRADSLTRVGIGDKQIVERFLGAKIDSERRQMDKPMLVV